MEEKKLKDRKIESCLFCPSIGFYWSWSVCECWESVLKPVNLLKKQYTRCKWRLIEMYDFNNLDFHDGNDAS